jgi:EamA domain-containing membrane protein RarD
MWVFHLHQVPHGRIFTCRGQTDLLLLGTGILTATPLLLFNLGAKRITLATLGFIQYTAPTGMLLLGITMFDEPFTQHSGRDIRTHLDCAGHLFVGFGSCSSRRASH